MRSNRRPSASMAVATLAVSLAVVAPAAARTVTHEKTANLQISRAVRDLLEAEGVSVRMTRATDRTLHPFDRTGLANRRRVDAFVSIHNNASTSREPSGAIVFHSIREDGSKRLGDRIRDAFRDEFGPQRRAQLTTRRGCCGDYYYQLRLTKMPAVLVEAAFVSNPAEGRALANDPEFRARIATSIADGILAYQRTLGAKRVPDRDRGLVLAGTHEPVLDTTARALGGTRVRLRWTAIDSGAARYRIYRDGRLIGERGAKAGAQVSFLDRWAAPGQTYSYEVRTTQPVLVDAVRAYREAVGVTVEETTPAISIVLDPGHGGRDPGAVRTW